MTLLHAVVRRYDLRLARVLRTRRGAFARRQGTLFVVHAADGISGVGDAAGWPDFGSGLDDDVLAAQLCDAALRLRGTSLPDAAAGCQALAQSIATAVEARHAVELALLDACAKAHGQSVAALLHGGPVPMQVPVHTLVDSAVAAQQAVRAGATTLKVKLGGRALDDEIAHVAAVFAAAGDDVALRLDVNGAWDEATAVRALRLLAAFSPAWVEQPVAKDDIEALARLRAQQAVPIAADEAAHDPDSLQRLLQLGAADVVVLKPMFCGGLCAAMQAAAQARAAAVQVTVTHALESAVGRAGAAHLASALAAQAQASGAAPLAAGLGSVIAAADDLASGVQVGAAQAQLAATPGLGLTLRPTAVPRAC